MNGNELFFAVNRKYDWTMPMHPVGVCLHEEQYGNGISCALVAFLLIIF